MFDKDDQIGRFLRRGYWRLGWADEEKPAMAKLRDKVKPGDRIAIKRMMGKGKSTIKIKALGVVKEIDEYGKIIFVDWVEDACDRIVDCRNCLGTIHGPYALNDEWVKEIFAL
jgi:hypothetical protein